MKNTRPLDPLEETLENPDLPPLAPVQVPNSRGVASAARRSVRVSLALGVLVLVVAAVSLRFVA